MVGAAVVDVHDLVGHVESLERRNESFVEYTQARLAAVHGNDDAELDHGFRS
jgi:hypothetical protein